MKHIRFMRYFISLALPVILQQLLAHLLAMSDTIMLGAFSEQAISAVVWQINISLFIIWLSLVLQMD